MSYCLLAANVDTSLQQMWCSVKCANWANWEKRA